MSVCKSIWWPDGMPQALSWQDRGETKELRARYAWSIDLADEGNTECDHLWRGRQRLMNQLTLATQMEVALFLLFLTRNLGQFLVCLLRRLGRLTCLLAGLFQIVLQGQNAFRQSADRCGAWAHFAGDYGFGESIQRQRLLIGGDIFVRRFGWR